MIGDRLRQLRKEKGYEAQYVAKLVNVTKSAYSGYENNRNMPSYDVLDKLANIFNVSTDYLLGRNEIPRMLSDEEAEALADRIIEILIEKGKIERGEVLSKEKREKILKEIDALIDLTNKLEGI